MADKHMDDDVDGDYSEYDSQEEGVYDDGEDTEGDVFEFNEVSEYVNQMNPVMANEKHAEIIQEAAARDLNDPDEKTHFLNDYRPFFKQKGTENSTILHSLARKMYDKSDGAKVFEYKKYIPLLKILLEDLPDLPTSVDSDQQTALHVVCKARQSEVAKYLVDNVASDPDWLEKRTKNGDTVLHIALRENLECVEHIINKIAAKGQQAADAMLSCQGEYQNTPLHIAVQYERCHGTQATLVKLLLVASDLALGKENAGGFSPVRYHQDTQKSYRSQHTPRITRSKPGSSASTPETKNEKSMSLRPRPKPSPGSSSRETPTKSSSTPAAGARPVIKKRQASELPAQYVAVDPEVVKTIQDLLLQHVLRTRSREEAIRILHGAIQRRQIDFDLWPLLKPTILADDLERYAGHLNFEPVLQYVAIPALEVDNFPMSKWKHEPFWESRGRKDYLAIFDWLYEKGVRHIVRVIVADHDDRPHSDAVIVRALNRFGVERLDWKRFDLCSHAIINAVNNVTQLKLYCNGNDAILRSWSSPTGLVNLRQLRKVEVDMYLGWETLSATKEAAAAFENEMREVWEDAWTQESRGSLAYAGRSKNIEVKCYVQNPLRTKRAVAQGDAEKKRDAQYEQREAWVDWKKVFANFIQNYDPQGVQPVIKVALIDDGVDSTFDDLSAIIKEGQSYSLRDKELGLWNPYYHSANGHGTVMACLIRMICPRVQLYVAKLNEIATQDNMQITASSAVKAINWAKEMGVHIMSMSWSIDKVSIADQSALQKAIDDAITSGILLFCASDDQGNTRQEDVDTWPARANSQRIFRIGAATKSGLPGEWVRGVDYILPGEKDQLVPSLGEQLSNHEPRTASSLATALGSGLAALILYCAALNDKNDFEALRTQEKMNQAFKNLSKSHQVGNQYLHVREVFQKYLPKGGVGDDEETENRKAIEQIVQHLLRD